MIMNRRPHLNSLLAILSLIVFLLPSPDMNAQRTTYWQQRASLFDILPVHNDDIVFLGNSITDGGEWGELFNNPKVKNRGISGDVVSGVAERLYQVVDGKPSKIFLLIGINDVSHNLSATQICSEYESLVKEIREKSPETRLYIQSVFPIDNDFNRFKSLNGREDVVVEINKRLPEIARKYKSAYIDLWPVLADKESGKLKKEFTNDGLHLTGPGYAAWVDAVRKYVEE